MPLKADITIHTILDHGYARLRVCDLQHVMNDPRYVVSEIEVTWDNANPDDMFHLLNEGIGRLLERM